MKAYAQQKYCCKWGWTLKQSAANRYQQQFGLDVNNLALVLIFNF